ncbi:hypothetical protein MYSTI_01556 [Myxococcus stipitatus DSM 14675]|uniref:Dickkopf N-terminal cysteine-rich domain-containing protein n=1 Tax=Myxococcus stipitatus (strain DSM 14675 / JCM 12634 / Mx s8) TaxID=1278073 RepID=L7U281_MYXSD|nr:hypothetical protein [Myxococcus stipitatus]AGC42891.1 hypothetical protein MYSTI_01556 [Myxococcus stipitatus DSM 14675]
MHRGSRTDSRRGTPPRPEHFTTSWLFGALLSLVLFMPTSASAYCIWNSSSEYVSVVRLPYSLLSSEYKDSIAPGDYACCNWDKGGCAEKEDQTGTSKFALYYDTDLDVIEAASAEDLEDALNDMANLIASLKGNPDSKVADNVIVGTLYFLFTGQTPSTTPLYMEDSQKFVDDFSSYLSLPLVGDVTTYTQTYNGGVLEAYEFGGLGCWAGPCQGQNINIDGSMGAKGSDGSCSANQVTKAGCCASGYMTADGWTCQQGDQLCGDNVCTTSQTCFQGECVDPSQICGGTSVCTTSQTCFQGGCVDPSQICGGTSLCTASQTCFQGACIDPTQMCVNVVCPTGQTCEEGVCVSSGSTQCGYQECFYPNRCIMGNCRPSSYQGKDSTESSTDPHRDYFLKKLSIPGSRDGIETLSRTPFRVELRRHARRLAFLARIEAVAADAQDAAATKHARELAARETQRHEKWMTVYMSGGHEALYSKEWTP